MPALEKAAAPHPTVVQHDRLGTGHAALQAAPLLEGFAGDAAVLYADNALITEATMRRLRAARDGAGLVLLAMRPPDPLRYGRVLTDAAGAVTRVVEWADATEAERAVALCNAGVVCAKAADLVRWLRQVRNDNAKGEYYLTDIVALAVAEGVRVAAVEAPWTELQGIDSRAQLADAEAEMQRRLRRAALDGGATLVQPDSVVFSFDTRSARMSRSGRTWCSAPASRSRTASRSAPSATWKAAPCSAARSSAPSRGCGRAPWSGRTRMSATSSS
jgi:bifunctional UDP-N-acetylglucosamine pyrophosphorylase/glucosamine-1-phosphate N-acetyltransferase